MSLICPSHIPYFPGLGPPEWYLHVSLICPSYVPYMSLICPLYVPHISPIFQVWDHRNGTYTCEFTPPKVGWLCVEVEYVRAGTGDSVPLIGSPWYPLVSSLPEWEVEEVCAFIERAGFPEWVRTFAERGVDGLRLCSLTQLSLEKVRPSYVPHMSLICPHMSLICPSYVPHMSLICPSYVPTTLFADAIVSGEGTGH